MLDEILAHKRNEIAQLKQQVSHADIERVIADLPPAISLKKALTRSPEIAIIAEVKRKSPSQGSIRSTVDPTDLAVRYDRAGAAAISVLTDQRFFDGSLDDLTAVRGSVKLPLLRKDFILGSIQLYEARARQADAVLLIVAALDQQTLASLHQCAADLGLDVLVECHDEIEAQRAVDAGAEIIGINNRNLHTFDVSLDTTLRIRPAIPESIVVVAESGIGTRADIEYVRGAGVDAVLVGTSIMAAPDPLQKICQLRGVNHDGR